MIGKKQKKKSEKVTQARALADHGNKNSRKKKGSNSTPPGTEAHQKNFPSKLAAAITSRAIFPYHYSKITSTSQTTSPWKRIEAAAMGKFYHV